MNTGTDHAAVIVEELTVLHNTHVVSNLALMPGSPPTLIVLSPDEVVAVPVQRCAQHATKCR